MSPGRYPRLSPASTAGRVSTIRPTLPPSRAATAGADREIGLAGPRRAQRDRQIMPLDRQHQPLLAVALRPDLTPVALLAFQLVGIRVTGRKPGVICAAIRPGARLPPGDRERRLQ